MGNDGATFPEFFVEAQEVVDALGRDLLAAEAAVRQGDVDPDLVNTLFRHAHSLKGICAMFGLNAMAALAHALEGVLDGMRLGRVDVNVAAFDALFACVERFGELLAQAAKGAPQNAEQISALVVQLKTVSQGKVAQPTPAAAVAATPQSTGADMPRSGEGVLCLNPETLKVLTEYEEHRLHENVRSKRHLALVSTLFPLASFDTDLARIDSLLKGHAEIISKLPSATSHNADLIGFELIVGSATAVDDLRRLLGDAALAVQGIDTSPLLPPEPQALPTGAAAGVQTTHASEGDVVFDAHGFAVLSEVLQASAGKAAEPRGPDVHEATDVPEAMVPGPPVAQTVRVDIRRLDRLMNLVGELSVTRLAIERISDALKQEYGFRGLAVDLHRESRAFDRRLAELQGGIMEVRMVPLATLFDRMVRVSRTIARELGRQVRVLVQGEHTELDKLIIEDLSDPLMHLIRNAIDHGIEPPAARLAQGKPAEGTVHLFAATQGNHVIVEVGDDGAGIDVDRTRKVGIERGMLRADEAEAMAERDIYSLLFVPGFSTRSVVSEFSGRGVGLDVVKTNISKLSGVIDVTSERNVGTRFTVTLPITLAIIPALIVQVGGVTYAIPLNAVMETVDLAQEPIRTIERRQVISVRGQTVPLLDLIKAFGLKAKPRTQPGYGVLAGMGSQRIAIVVDELVGQQDIVIKSLGRRLRDVFGVAGATDLGNQQTILVLDIMSLMGYLSPAHAAETL
jgi:two-component system chemotaxis sensor kinase CheA